MSFFGCVSVVLFFLFAFFAVSVCFRRFPDLLSPFCFFVCSGLLFFWVGLCLGVFVACHFVCVPVCGLVSFLLFSLFCSLTAFFCFIWFVASFYVLYGNS